MAPLLLVLQGLFRAQIMHKMDTTKRRLLVSELIGRPLRRWEVVHHVDGNHDNDNIMNLSIVTLSQHQRLHEILERRLAPNHPLSQEMRKLPHRVSDLIMRRIALDISC